ncbi:MAG: hypothetical protein AAF824_23135 [Bacteroidota bacterium]
MKFEAEQLLDSSQFKRLHKEVSNFSLQSDSLYIRKLGRSRIILINNYLLINLEEKTFGYRTDSTNNLDSYNTSSKATPYSSHKDLMDTGFLSLDYKQFSSMLSSMRMSNISEINIKEDIITYEWADPICKHPYITYMGIIHVRSEHKGDLNRFSSIMPVKEGFYQYSMRYDCDIFSLCCRS